MGPFGPALLQGASIRARGRFTGGEQTQLAPADQGEPGLRSGHGRVRDHEPPPWDGKSRALERRTRAAFSKTFEPGGRRKWVGQERATRARLVLSEVGEHVAKSRPHGSRRRQGARMVAIGPEPAALAEQLVHSPRDADHEPAHARRERPLVPRLDDQMEMVVLHGKVHDSKRFLAPTLVRDRAHEGRKHLLLSK